MARLSKGQLAPGVIARADRTKASVLRRFDLLHSQPEACASISTLSALAEWSDPRHGITPVSANSIRKYAKEYYPGGIRGLLNRLSEGRLSSDNRGRSVGCQGGLTDAEVERMADSILRWSDRYGDLVDRMRNLAAIDESVRRELNAHRKRYEWPKPILRVVGK